MALCRNLAGLFILCLLCAGCYESKYPLSSTDTARIDARLLNGWVEQDPKPGDTPYRVAIFKFSDTEYCIAFCNDNGTATLARAFTAMVDNVPVLNMQGIESANPKDRTFVFFKYAFTPEGILQAWMISSDSPLLEKKTFSSQTAFSAYITKHIHDNRLFGDMQRFKPAAGMSLKLFSGP